MATWPNTIILVHGYADSRLPVGDNANANKGQEGNFWYWQGKYSDAIEEYNVPQDLINAAAADGAQVQIKAANWDGRSKIETSVEYLVTVLDKYCTGSNTCDLVGHSTGDVLIGYALDKYQSASSSPDGKAHSWNINTVFVAGGAGGGTEAASWDVAFGQEDPVVKELRPLDTRALYNHNMSGKYASVPNVRFVGAGTNRDYANPSINWFTKKPQPFIPYDQGAGLCRGYSDGLVPFHSQGGVSTYLGITTAQANDAYCTEKHTGVFLSCGQLNPGNADAQRWTTTAYVNVPLFNGFSIALIDYAREYNHSDEVGRLAQWIINYKRQTVVAPPVAPPVVRVVYWGTDSHIHELRLEESWIHADLSAIASAVPTAGGPSAYVTPDEIPRVVYQGTDSHIHELRLQGSWIHADLSAIASAAPASAVPTAGHPSAYVTPDGIPRVVYRGTDNDIHELRLQESWIHADLSTIASAAPAAADPYAYVTSADNIPRVVYLGTDSHIHELRLQGSWIHADLSAIASAAPAAADPVAYVTPDGIPRVVYVGTDQHIHELRLQGSWIDADLSAIASAVPRFSNPFAYVTPDGIPRVVYVGTDQHIHELRLQGSWIHADLSAISSAAPAPAASNPFAYVTSADDIPRVVYVGTDGNIYELRLEASWIQAALSAIASDAPPAGSATIILSPFAYAY